MSNGTLNHALVFALGLMASTAIVGLSITSRRKNVIIMSSMISLLTGLQYATLGRWTTAVMCAVALVLGGLYFMDARPGWRWISSRTATIATFGLYGGLYIAMSGLSFGLDIMAFVGTMLSVVIMRTHAPLFAKWAMLTNGFVWGTYQAIIGAYGQLPGQVFYLAGVTFSLVAMYRLRARGADIATAPELAAVILGGVRKWRTGRVLRAEHIVRIGHIEQHSAPKHDFAHSRATRAARVALVGLR